MSNGRKKCGKEKSIYIKCFCFFFKNINNPIILCNFALEYYINLIK